MDRRIKDDPKYKSHIELMREAFLKKWEKDQQDIWDREHEYIMNRSFESYKFEIMDLGKETFKPGDWIIFKSVMKDWFDDGSDMEVSIPGVIVEISNEVSKCKFLSFGEEKVTIIALDRLSHRMSKEDFNLTNKKPSIMNDEKKSNAASEKKDPTLISLRSQSGGLVDTVKSALAHSQSTLDAIIGQPATPTGTSEKTERSISPVDFIANNLDEISEMVRDIHNNLSHIDRVIGHNDDN